MGNSCTCNALEVLKYNQQGLVILL